MNSIVFPSTICVLVFCVLLRFINTERRITDGKLAENKRYAVYFVKRDESKQEYDEWICGGAIVSPVYVVTSAACIEDVEHMYVVAGYKKYVHSNKIDKDPCTRKHKKKVVYVCMPSAYKFSYPDVERWSWADIAVAKVESPYNFRDKSYLKSCSYIPNKIRINYERRYQLPGIDALALGWGHRSIWRPTDDTRDLNSKMLRGGSVLIEQKPRCKKQFTQYPKLQKLIDKYMICTMKRGNIDASGGVIKKTDPDKYIDGCGPKGALRGTPLCREDGHNLNILRSNNNNTQEDTIYNPTRRDGICQNDHGGPLVTWIGSHEVLIGVASLFRINHTSNHCIGPYLFTSTWCSSAFLHCIIEETDKTRRRNICEKGLKEQGLTLVKRDVSWEKHPDGPAEREMVKDESEIVKDESEMIKDESEMDKDESEMVEVESETVKIRPQISLNDMYNS